ncbi:hypothetical protein EJB05_31733 [Eragrostis curvula]|uniref:Uncharacterized protein n=1 Tax=Eragrostis curvula TaxID=38414 RepID=A0A5J9UFF2_9POAL|nr:hypothetical protein EJB05_31733 [Eragrostis curvula]
MRRKSGRLTSRQLIEESHLSRSEYLLWKLETGGSKLNLRSQGNVSSSRTLSSTSCTTTVRIKTGSIDEERRSDLDGAVAWELRWT